MPKQNLNIKADLKKYKPVNNKPRGRPPTGPVRFVVNGNLLSEEKIREVIVSNFIPGIKTPLPSEPDNSWKRKEMEYRRDEISKIVVEEERRMEKMAADPNQFVSPFQRSIYLNCGHKVSSYVSTIKLNSFYWCDTCILFKRVNEVVY